MGLEYLSLRWPQRDGYEPLACFCAVDDVEVGKALDSEISGEKAENEQATTEDGYRSSRTVSSVEFEEILLSLLLYVLCQPCCDEGLYLRANFIFHPGATDFPSISEICMSMV